MNKPGGIQDLFADPGDIDRYKLLEEQLNYYSLSLNFPIKYTFSLNQENGRAEIIFEQPLLQAITEEGLRVLENYWISGMEESFNQARYGEYLTAQDLLNLALEQFTDHGTPDIPIRSILKLSAGEYPHQQILVAKHISAGLVLDLLEGDVDFYGRTVETATIDQLIVEEPLEATAIQTTTDYPLAKIEYTSIPGQPNLITAIVIEKLPAPDGVKEQTKSNAEYTLNLLYTMLEMQT